MTRTSSKDSTASQNLPFTQTGPMPPPVQLHSQQKNQNMLDAWQRDPPYHPFSQMRRSQSQRISDLENVPELEHVGESPADFLARSSFGATPIPAMPPTPLRRHRLSTSSRHSLNIPVTPTTMTDATTSMSRQNSLFNEPLLESIQMMKFDSQTSYSSDMLNVDNQYHVSPSKTSPQSHCSFDEERSQLLRSVGAGPNSQVPSPSHLPIPQSSYPPFQFLDSLYGGEKMEASQSSESSSSTSSTKSRNKQRLQVSNQAAARPLMPKAGSGSDDESQAQFMSRDASSQSMMSRVASLGREGVQDKIAISKPAYQRPKHERVYCKDCDEHPEGFRGEHELRRHHDRQHKAMVKKYICVEPTSGSNHAKPVLPLSRCKSCTTLKKKYGAYYNAAAHLRRAHFKPKAKGRSKSSKLEESQKRGGKGGGDWPPMTELKQWMKEVYEPATDYSITAAQQQAADESDDEDCEMDDALDEHHYPLGTATNTDNFDATAIFDLFATTSSPTDLTSEPSTLSHYQDHYNISQQPFDTSMDFDALHNTVDPALSYTQPYSNEGTTSNATITPEMFGQDLLDDPFCGLESASYPYI